MTIGLLGLERLRHSLLTAAIGQIHEIGHSIRESHPFQKCEDCEPRIKRIARIRNFKILKTENGKRNFHRRALGLSLTPKIAQNRRSHPSKTTDS
jgi:ribosomal protein L34E